MPPAIPSFSSFLLDIEIVRTGDLPAKQDDLRPIFAELRQSKNQLFEQMITDEARQIFSGPTNV
jgi:uncharacterized protein (TIGR04255 family)